MLWHCAVQDPMQGNKCKLSMSLHVRICVSYTKVPSHISRSPLLPGQTCKHDSCRSYAECSHIAIDSSENAAIDSPGPLLRKRSNALFQFASACCPACCNLDYPWLTSFGFPTRGEPLGILHQGLLLLFALALPFPRHEFLPVMFTWTCIVGRAQEPVQCPFNMAPWQSITIYVLS